MVHRVGAILLCCVVLLGGCGSSTPAGERGASQSPATTASRAAIAPTATPTSTPQPSVVATAVPTPVAAAKLLTITAHTADVWALALSPDGRTLASAAQDGTIRFWNLDGSERLRIALPVDLSYNLAWSPDGQILAAALAGHTIQLWNADGSARGGPLLGHSDRVSSFAWSPDGRTLAAASWDKTIRLWDVDGMTRGRVLIGHTAEVADLDWSPDGATLASASSDGTVRLWHLDRLSALTVASSSPPRIVPGTPTLTGPVYILTGHTSAVASVAWSPDGRTIVSSAYDGTLRWWNPDGSSRRAPVDNQAQWGTGVRWSREGRYLLSGLRFWLPDGTLYAGPFEFGAAKVGIPQQLPDGRFISITTFDNRIEIWEVDPPASIRTILADGLR